MKARVPLRNAIASQAEPLKCYPSILHQGGAALTISGIFGPPNLMNTKKTKTILPQI